MKNIRCPRCAGKKKVIALGLSEKTCPKCAGTGEVECQVETALSKIEDKEEVVEKKGKSKSKIEDKEEVVEKKGKSKK